MTQHLRDYQQSALDRLRTSVQAGYSRTLLVAPTGSGKTTIAAAMIHSAVGRGGSVLFLAHRKELIDQCSERLDGAGVEHGVIMAGHPRWLPWLPVQVASIQTLVRRQLQREPTLIIIDESHRARARTYSKVLNQYPSAPVIGLTATPWRTDGKGLGELFQALVVAARPAELIAAGHLVPFTGFAYDSPELNSVKRKGHDYEQPGLELVMGAKPLVGNIVEQWFAHAGGARTVVFAVTRQHSHLLVARFRERGAAAEHVDGETPKREREAILARLRSGATRIVSNVGILTEGFDLPALECCILARPTLSAGLYLQQVGRVMRPAPGKLVARIHDHAGCIVAHGLPDAHRDYELGGDEAVSSRGPKPEPLRTCKACFAIYDPSCASQCPQCGTAAEPRARVFTEIDGKAIPIEELQNIRGADSERQRRNYYDRKCAEAQERGYKPGWAAMSYRAVYRQWPPASWRERGAA